MLSPVSTRGQLSPFTVKLFDCMSSNGICTQWWTQLRFQSKTVQLMDFKLIYCHKLNIKRSSKKSKKVKLLKQKKKEKVFKQSQEIYSKCNIYLLNHKLFCYVCNKNILPSTEFKKIFKDMAQFGQNIGQSISLTIVDTGLLF